jgi:hypothetical protein
MQPPPVEQAPPLQLPPPGQTRLHMPQWAALVRRSTQTEPQRVDPVGHAGTHRPLEHMPVPPPPGAGHAFPQKPQWLAFVVMFTSHPLDARPSQSRKPVAQVRTQTPAMHCTAVALVPAVHTFPQPPQ